MSFVCNNDGASSTSLLWNGDNMCHVGSKEKNLVYVYEWTDDNASIYGFGCDYNGNAALLKPYIKPGLFVLSGDVDLLKAVSSLYGFHEIEVYEKFQYRSNNFALWDILIDRSVQKAGILVKIVTPTVADSVKIFRIFRNNSTSCYKFASVPLYWDVTKQMLFELLVRSKCHERDFSRQCPLDANQTEYDPLSGVYCPLPNPVMCWLDDNLNQHVDIDKPNLPLISFDIETVSSDPNRVPDGTEIDDILFTVSIHHTHTNKLYTLAYIPIRSLSQSELRMLIRKDGYPEYRDCENVLEIFNNELDLLKRTMQLLTIKQKLHYLIGYNSFNYDIKFLFTRCVFYNICVDDFFWRDGLIYTMNQIHLDFYRIAIMRYRLKRYTLAEVSKEILNDSKVGVSAVALRYTFHRMLINQKYFTKDQSNKKNPAVSDALLYNNYDTLLVSKLVKQTDAVTFMVDHSVRCMVPMSTLNSNYNKMKYKLWNECFVLGLKAHIFLGTFKKSEAILQVPLYYDVNNATKVTDYVTVTIDLMSKMTNSSDLRHLNEKPYKRKNTNSISNGANNKNDDNDDDDDCGGNYGGSAGNDGCNYTNNNIPPKSSFYKGNETSGESKKKFPGGANFCLGEYDVENVQAYDKRIAYPLLIDRKNISDETVALLPANIILQYWYSLENKEQFTVHDYMKHNGNNKTETNILYYKYIYNNLYCGGEFPFTEAELKKRANSAVVLIWSGRRGILSDIVAIFNKERERTKDKRSVLKNALEMIEGALIEFVERRNLTNLMARKTYDKSKDIRTSDAINHVSLNDRDNYNNNDAAADDDDDYGGNNDAKKELGCNKNMPSVNSSNRNSFNSNINNSSSTFDDGKTNDASHSNQKCDVASVVEPSFDLLNDLMSSDDDDDDNDCDNDYRSNNNNGNVKDGINDDNDGNNTADDFNKNCNDFDFDLNDQTEEFVKFSFDDTFIKISSTNFVEIDRDALGKSADPVGVLENLKTDVHSEFCRYENWYLLLKSIVSSIYGCMGEMCPILAGCVTCFSRSTLLSVCQYARQKGYIVYYVDTDSMFIKHSDPTKEIVDISAEINARYPHIEIEMKILERVLFVQKKVYYKIAEGCITYGQHVNGPYAWREFIEFVYNQQNIKTSDDILITFESFFDKIYGKLTAAFDGETAAADDEDIWNSHVGQQIKLKNFYKTNTPSAKYRTYLQQKFPELAGYTKHDIYYFLHDDVKLTIYRPIVELVSIEDIAKINFFKFYQNVFQTACNIIIFHLRRNNKPYHIKVTSDAILLLMMKAFLSVHNARYGA